MSVSTGSRDWARFHGYGCGARSLTSCLRKVNVKNLRIEINASLTYINIKVMYVGELFLWLGLLC